MERSKFVDKVMQDLPAHLPEDWKKEVTIRPTTVTKMNDRVLQGIVLVKEEGMPSPTLYLDPYYARLEQGEEYEQLLQEFAAECMLAMQCPPPMIREFDMTRSRMRQKLSARVISAPLNREYLRNIPCTEIVPGLMLVCDLCVPDGQGGQWRTRIDENLMEEIGYDRTQLLENALRRSMKANPPVLTDPIAKGDMGPNLLTKRKPIPEKDKNVMYVLTTKDIMLGSIALFYPGVQKRIANLLGNYYAVPSSVHEFMIIPQSLHIHPVAIHAMLLEANHSVVESRDILSNDLYYYDAQQEQLGQVDMTEYGENAKDDGTECACS